ncbi:hypothetical protein TIFTF001_014456 [Ficus carica]|uniref:Uncharacterized protein n=1 Tax=Ficus carica TaxID=3494 RepID=A0AA88A3X8_FICCA|nr:hypothetical protein TIFTF001_014456 [Ficus carica]
MATAGSYIAEAHVMRKLHKEKMKRMEEETTKRSSDDKDDDVVSGVKRSSSTIGCFGMFRKIHPSSNVAALEDGLGSRGYQ